MVYITKRVVFEETVMFYKKQNLRFDRIIAK